MIHLFENIKQTISNRFNQFDDGDGTDLNEETTNTAAFARCSELRSLHPGRRRLKENYTSHWDLDYLPGEEVERLIEEAKAQSNTASD